MFGFTSIEERAAREAHLRELAMAELRKAQSDLDYVAMMSGVELDTAETAGGTCEAERAEAEEIEQAREG